MKYDTIHKYYTFTFLTEPREMEGYKTGVFDV